MSVWRSAARALMPQLFRMGFAANEAINELRRMGYSYRRNRMLTDYRSVTGKMKLQDRVEALGGDQRPGRYHMVETELRQPERSYRVFGEVEFYDWERREWRSKNISFYDDYLRTKDDWENEFIRQFGDVYGTYDQTIERINVYSIEHNIGHFY